MGKCCFGSCFAFANGKDLGASDQEWDSGASRRAFFWSEFSPSLGDNKSIYLPPFCKGKNNLQNGGFWGAMLGGHSEIWGNRVPVGRKKMFMPCFVVHLDWRFLLSDVYKSLSANQHGGFSNTIKNRPCLDIASSLRIPQPSKQPKSFCERTEIMKVVDLPIYPRKWTEGVMHKQNHLQTCLGVEINLFVVGIVPDFAPPLYHWLDHTIVDPF